MTLRLTKAESSGNGAAPPEWKGQELGENDLALVTAGNPEGTETSCTGFVAASDEHGAVFVPTERVGAFLLTHQHCQIYCYDVGQLHRHLSDAFDRFINPSAKQLLWRLSRSCRLIDVSLLDQRWRFATRSVYSGPCSLAVLVNQYGVSPTDEGHPPCPVQADDSVNAISVLNVGKWLTNEIRQVFPDRTRRTPDAVGLDVAAAIAFAFIERHGLVIDYSIANKLYQAADELFVRCSHDLHKDKAARHQFRWKEGGRIRVRDDGEVDVDQSELENWLWRQWVKAHDDAGGGARRPYDLGLPLDPEQWEDLVLFRHTLRAWRDLTRAAKLMAWLRSSLTSSEKIADKVSFRWNLVPRLRLLSPNLLFIRKLGFRIFMPSQNCSFLIVELRDLLLRCWAVVTAGAEPAYIAQLFRDGVDPASSLAARLHEAETGRQIVSDKLCQTKGLGENYWPKAARVMLDSLPRGLSEAQFKGLFHDSIPDRDFPLFEFKRLRKVLVEALGADIPLSSAPPYPREWSIEDFRGEFTSNEGRDERPPRRNTLIQRAGSVERHESEMKPYVQKSQMLADDVRKALVYALVAASYDVVAQAGNEIVIEVPSNRKFNYERVVRIIELTLSAALGSLGKGCRQFDLADRW